MELYKNLSLLVLIAGISTLLYFVFAPFLIVLVLAAVLAVLLHAPYERLARAFGGWKSAAALVTVGLTLVLVITPLFFLGVQIFQQAQSLYLGMQGNGAQSVQAIQAAIENPICNFFPEFTFDLHTYVGNMLAFISNDLGYLVYKTIAVLFETFLMLLALFYFLRDGRGLLAALTSKSPFGKEVTDDMVRQVRLTIRSVVRGTLFIVLIRSACMWAAFSLFGIPNAILWGVAGGVLGAIPGLGTAFAFVIAVAYLYLQGSVLLAIGLAMLGSATVILVDNILTSYFFSRGLDVPPIFMLFAILGGLLFFGPLGFLLGPLVLSIFLSVVRA